MSGNISDLIQADALDGSELIELTKVVNGLQKSRQSTTGDIARLVPKFKVIPFNPRTASAPAPNLFTPDLADSTISNVGTSYTLSSLGNPPPLSSALPYLTMGVTSPLNGTLGDISLPTLHLSVYSFMLVHKSTSTAESIVSNIFTQQSTADATIILFGSPGATVPANLVNADHPASSPLAITSLAMTLSTTSITVNGIAYPYDPTIFNAISIVNMSLNGVAALVPQVFTSTLLSTSYTPTPLPVGINPDDVLEITGAGTVLGVNVKLNTPPDWLRYYVDPITLVPSVRLEHDTALDLSTLSNNLNVVGSKTVEVSDVPSLSPIVLTTKPTGIFTFVSSQNFIPASGGQPDSIGIRLAPNFRSGKIVVTNHNHVYAGLAVIADQPKATMLGSFNAIAENTLVQQSVLLGTPLDANTSVEPFVSTSYDVSATSDAVLIKETIKACSELKPLVLNSLVLEQGNGTSLLAHNWKDVITADISLATSNQGYLLSVSPVSCEGYPLGSGDIRNFGVQQNITLDRTNGLTKRILQNLYDVNTPITDVNGSPATFTVGTTYNASVQLVVSIPQPIGSVDYNGGLGVVSATYAMGFTFIYEGTPTNTVTFAGIGLLPAAATPVNWSCSVNDGTTLTYNTPTAEDFSGFLALLKTIPQIVVTYDSGTGNLTLSNAKRLSGLTVTLTTDGVGVFTPSGNSTFTGSGATSTTGTLTKLDASPIALSFSSSGKLLAYTDKRQPESRLYGIQTLNPANFIVPDTFNAFLVLPKFPSNVIMGTPVFAVDSALVVFSGVSQDGFAPSACLYPFSCDGTGIQNAVAIPVVNNFPTNNFKQVAISLDKNTIFAVGDDNALYQFNLVSGSYTSVGTTAINLGLQANDVLKEFAMSPDGTKLALVTSNTSGFDSVYVFSWNGTTLTIVPSFPVVASAGSVGSVLYGATAISISDLVWTEDSKNVLLVQYGTSTSVYEIGIILITTPAITNLYSDFGSGGSSHALSGLSISGSRLFFLSTAYSHNPFISYIDLNLTDLSVITPVAPSYEPAYVALNSLSINKADGKTLAITDTSPRGFSLYALNDDNSISFIN
jgi:hypothetical protein